MQLALNYKGRQLKQTYTPDFVLFDKIILEIKAVSHYPIAVLSFFRVFRVFRGDTCRGDSRRSTQSNLPIASLSDPELAVRKYITTEHTEDTENVIQEKTLFD